MEDGTDEISTSVLYAHDCEQRRNDVAGVLSFMVCASRGDVGTHSPPLHNKSERARQNQLKKNLNFFLVVVVIIVAVLAGLFLPSYCFPLSVNDETQKWEKGLLKKNDAIHEDRENARYGNGRHFAPINFGCTQIGAASGNNESLSAI